MWPIPIGAGVRVAVASRIDTEIGGCPGYPVGIRFFTMSNNVISVFRITEFRGDMGCNTRRGLILGFGVPGWITRKPFVLSACGMLVPTESMPGVICFQHHLGNFTGRRI